MDLQRLPVLQTVAPSVNLSAMRLAWRIAMIQYRTTTGRTPKTLTHHHTPDAAAQTARAENVLGLFVSREAALVPIAMSLPIHVSDQTAMSPAALVLIAPIQENVRATTVTLPDVKAMTVTDLDSALAQTVYLLAASVPIAIPRLENAPGLIAARLAARVQAAKGANALAMDVSRKTMTATPRKHILAQSTFPLLWSPQVTLRKHPPCVKPSPPVMPNPQLQHLQSSLIVP